MINLKEDKKIILVTAIAAVIGATAIVTYYRSATIKVNSAISGAMVTINGKTYPSGQSIDLKPGVYEVSVSKPFYPTITKEINVEAGDNKTVTIDLAGVEKQQLDNRIISDKELSDARAKNLKQYPFLNDLPYVNRNFQIDIGVSQKSGSSDHDVAFYITAKDEGGKIAAQNWLKSKGANLSKLEIIYRTSVPKPQSLN